MYKVLFKVLGLSLRTNHKIFIAILLHMGALFAISCLLQGLKGIQVPHPPAAMEPGGEGSSGRESGTMGGSWVGVGGLLQQSDLGAEISPHVTRARDPIHGMRTGQGPALVPSHCGQGMEGKVRGTLKHLQ